MVIRHVPSIVTDLQVHTGSTFLCHAQDVSDKAMIILYVFLNIVAKISPRQSVFLLTT